MTERGTLFYSFLVFLFFMFALLLDPILSHEIFYVSIAMKVIFLYIFIFPAFLQYI